MEDKLMATILILAGMGLIIMSLITIPVLGWASVCVFLPGVVGYVVGLYEAHIIVEEDNVPPS